jgi:hypothetical protein
MPLLPGFGAARLATQNVVLVTTDGLRWQEVFRGAEEALMDRRGGVRNPEALKKLFLRSTPSERREALLPFFWNVLARQGQLFGNLDQESPVRVSNGLNFSYPGYHEMLAGYVDRSIDSNSKRNNPNRTVLEWLQQKPAFQGKVAAFCTWDVFPYILHVERSGLVMQSSWEPPPFRKQT